MTTITGSLRHPHRTPEAAVPARTGSRLPQLARKGLFVSLLKLLISWQERANQRHCLARLDERLLRDIGLDRTRVAQETAKPFWRA